jgi:hypothetical protein
VVAGSSSAVASGTGALQAQSSAVSGAGLVSGQAAQPAQLGPFGFVEGLLGRHSTPIVAGTGALRARAATVAGTGAVGWDHHNELALLFLAA